MVLAMVYWLAWSAREVLGLNTEDTISYFIICFDLFCFNTISIKNARNEIMSLTFVKNGINKMCV